MTTPPANKPARITGCSIPDCTRPARSRGWCNTHYERWRRHGTTDDPRPTLWDRFWPKVDATGDCWEWTAATNQLGYGQIAETSVRRVRMAHRVAWELLVGPIPDGLELDHLCRNRRCVNPDHLEPVTHAENIRRAPWSAARYQRAKTHCPAGHAYAGTNLVINSRGRRECRTCQEVRRAA